MHLIPTILNTMLILSTTKKMAKAIINLKGRESERKSCEKAAIYVEKLAL